MTDLLTVDGVTKRYGTVTALDDVHFSLRAGEVHALLGENGAGKSTFLKLLNGLEFPDRGELRLDGAPLSVQSPAAAHALGLRYVRQEPEVVADVSVAENVFLGRLPARGGWVDRTALRRETEALLDELGLTGFLRPGDLGRSLSPAQRQLIEILRALHEGARVIAFDEPTSSLGDRETRVLYDLVRALRRRGTSVIYVSHRLQEIFDLTDRVTVLRDGRNVDTVVTADSTQQRLIQLMVGRDLSDMHVRTPETPGPVVLRAAGVTTADVRDVDLEVRAGEVVGLGGLVGAGRTELAHALVGAVPLQAGSVSVDGRAVRLTSPSAAVRAGICLAPEERKSQALLLSRTIRDNVVLAVLSRVSRARVVVRSQERAVAQTYADRLRVRAPSIETPVSSLSGGNQQKVVLARWLARKPRVLILDEPTRGIDVGAKAEIYRIVGELAASGVAVLLISSDMPELLGLSDRIVVMRQGRVSGELRRDEASETAVLRLSLAHHGEDARA